jgi:hypothetical protein
MIESPEVKSRSFGRDVVLFHSFVFGGRKQRKKHVPLINLFECPVFFRSVGAAYGEMGITIGNKELPFLRIN